MQSCIGSTVDILEVVLIHALVVRRLDYLIDSDLLSLLQDSLSVLLGPQEPRQEFPNFRLWILFLRRTLYHPHPETALFEAQVELLRAATHSNHESV